MPLQDWIACKFQPATGLFVSSVTHASENEPIVAAPLCVASVLSPHRSCVPVGAMATKRAAASPKPSKEAVRKGATSEDALHRFNVLLEDVRSQQNAMLEAIASMGESLERKFDERFTRIEQRLEILESVVRQNSEDIRKNSEDIRKNSEDIETMRIELQRLRKDFDTRDERAQIRALEERVGRLEQRLAG